MFGATALDNRDGDLTSSIVVTGLPVDSSAVGKQLVTYAVVDSRNLAASKTQTPPTVLQPDQQFFNRTYTLAGDAVGMCISFNYSRIAANNVQFLIVELGSHPARCAI